MEDKTRKQLRKFLEQSVKGDVAAEGETAIYRWKEVIERDDNYFNLYKLTETDKQQIKNILAEYFAAREQEEAEYEKRSLAEERADEITANYYADRIKKIVLSKPNKFLPKLKAPPPQKSH